MPNKPEPQDEGVLASIVVLIEWGGVKPSSTFYNRLHSYGLYSRMPGDVKESDEFDLLQWRASRNGDNKREFKRGVILQEGAIMVNNLQLASDIAGWAKQEGCMFVHIGHMVTKEFKMSERDLVAFQSLQRNVGKRGPKRQAEVGSYAVTCFSEAKTYQVDLEATPFMCPYCSSSNIAARMGQATSFQIDFEGTPEEYWKRTRFSTKTFEVPTMIQNVKGKPVAKSPKLTVPEIDLPELIGMPDEVLAWKETDITKYWNLLDVAYCVSQYTNAQRLEGRLLVINAYIVSGGEEFISFNPPLKGVDIADLCIIDRKYAEYL